MTKQKRRKMTPRQLHVAAKKGRNVKATAKSVPGETKARTALKLKELNGYRAEDIAHFFLNAHRHYFKAKEPMQRAYAHMIVCTRSAWSLLPMRKLPLRLWQR